MDKRRELYIDERIRRAYINRTERKLFKLVFLPSSVLIMIGLTIYESLETKGVSIINLILSNMLSGIVLGLALAMIVSAAHNLFRQQILRNFTGTEDYIAFRENELKRLYDRGLITESEYLESV